MFSQKRVYFSQLLDVGSEDKSITNIAFSIVFLSPIIKEMNDVYTQLETTIN